MTQPDAAYGTMISQRSRRLRLVGGMLLLAVLAMALYGVLSLMPSLRTARLNYTELTATTRITRDISQPPRALPDPTIDRAHRVVLAKVIFAYGYWTVCGILLVTLILVAWLDFREVSRMYLNRRRALWDDPSLLPNSVLPSDDRTHER